MDYSGLLHKLIAIERAIGVESNKTIREMVEDAQDCLLQMQKQRAEGLLTEAWRDAIPRPNMLRRVS
ncbi:MAG: hypothetical protein ACLQG3_14780 [Terracidiphilus sp.]